VAVSKYEGENYDIWVYDVERGTLTRLTFEGSNVTPAWTPDGKRLLFCSNRIGAYDIYSKRADGSEEVELFFSSEKLLWSPSLSGDGESLTFYEIDPETQRDIWTMQFRDKSASPLINTSANERAPAFSPDGRWVAYMSDESGRWEVFVTPYPKADGKWQISTDGGIEPVWSPDGQELFYREKSKMMAVSIETSPSFKAGKPKMLFEKMYYSYSYTSSYDIHPDGNRFLMIKAEEEPDSNQISIVLNWDEELKRLVPVDKR
jgi:Tol biopolymer transport system component